MTVIERTDLPMAIEGDGVEFRTDHAGEQSVAWVRLPAGTDLRPGLVGLPDDLCPVPHWGYMISGKLVMHCIDGDEMYEAARPSTGLRATPQRRLRIASTWMSLPPRDWNGLSVICKERAQPD